jgi:hypothetical protein
LIILGSLPSMNFCTVPEASACTLRLDGIIVSSRTVAGEIYPRRREQYRAAPEVLKQQTPLAGDIIKRTARRESSRRMDYG